MLHHAPGALARTTPPVCPAAEHAPAAAPAPRGPARRTPRGHAVGPRRSPAGRPGAGKGASLGPGYRSSGCWGHGGRAGRAGSRGAARRGRGGSEGTKGPAPRGTHTPHGGKDAAPRRGGTCGTAAPVLTACTAPPGPAAPRAAAAAALPAVTIGIRGGAAT